MKKIFLFGLFIAALINCYAQAQLKIINTFKIASTGGWDYIAVQPNANRVFASHGGQVNILDKVTGDSLGFIPNTTGVHGIAFIPSLNKGFTSNGRLNTVTVFDLKTFAVKDSIATGQNPDAIFYDEYSKRLITCNGRSNDLSFIDPVSSKVTATVAVGGKPETAVSNGAGKIFVNIEDKNEIVVINTNTFSAEAHWSLLPGEAPTGLAIDLATKRLFAACSDTKLLVVLDAEKGNIVQKIPIGAGCDGAGFDNSLKNIYTSNGEGTLTVIHEDSKDKYSVTATIKTKRGARTMTVDPETHKLYLPTAEFDPASKQGERPKMIPGTFQILVLGTE
ncbi:MAG: YncE family protein [Bacteroidota bacterium]